jgi:hypothetical protein
MHFESRQKETPDPGTVAKDGRRTPGVNKRNLAAFSVCVNQIIDEKLSVS